MARLEVSVQYDTTPPINSFALFLALILGFLSMSFQQLYSFFRPLLVGLVYYPTILLLRMLISFSPHVCQVWEVCVQQVSQERVVLGGEQEPS